jgi:hypothetical protein
MHENAVSGNHANLNPPAGQKVMQAVVTIPIEECFNFGLDLVPAFLERRFPDML